MSVGARDAENRPVVGRALGCRVSDDRRRVTIFLSASREAQVLACLRANGAIALAVTRPTTNESLQLKGIVLDVAPLSDGDRRALVAYRESFATELGTIGYGREFSLGVQAGGEDAVAVLFEPAAVFNQTPGPKAGTRLDARG